MSRHNLYKWLSFRSAATGAVQEIIYSRVAGRSPLEANELRYFQEIITAKADASGVDLVRTYYQEVEMTTATINIVSATQVGVHRLRLVFDDKTVQEVDFAPFLMHSRHPDVRAYLHPERFSSFQVNFGELVWGDYELCFPMIDLYHNSIEHTETMAQVA